MTKMTDTTVDTLDAKTIATLEDQIEELRATIASILDAANVAIKLTLSDIGANCDSFRVFRNAEFECDPSGEASVRRRGHASINGTTVTLFTDRTCDSFGEAIDMLRTDASIGSCDIHAGTAIRL